jgi:ABC-type Zn uptake system ZnuABC Zn-binding protein ZnuA
MLKSLFYLLILSFFVSACGEKKSPAQPISTRPIVLVSSPPYAYITKMVAGTTVDIECLIPPGTNPHLFEVSPKQVQKILCSSLWLRLGEPMEKKFLDIFRARNPNLQIVDLSESVDLLDLPHHTSPVTMMMPKTVISG